MKGDKLERQGGSGRQKQNHEGRQAWETRRQRLKLVSLHDFALGCRCRLVSFSSLSPVMISLLAAAAALSPKLVSLHDFAFVCRCRLVSATSEITKGDKLGKQGGSGSQEQNEEGRQAWETGRQRQPKATS